MGYTHYWKAKKFTAEDKAGWKKALLIIKKILECHAALIQFESDDKRKPVASLEQIRFNGIEDDGYETFLLNAEPTDFEFCKTSRKPYDLAVCEVLLVLNSLMPSLEVSSDGFSMCVSDQENGPKLDENWDTAIQNVKQYGISYHAEIASTHGGEDGKPDPYCTLKLVPGEAVPTT